MIVQVTFIRIGTGARGDRYRVMHNGLVIVESSRDPEHDACRVLVALGVTGILETRHSGSSIVSIRKDIERGAMRAVIENKHEGPRIGRFKPFEAARRLRPSVARGSAIHGENYEGVAPLP